MSILTGDIQPTSGEVLINGQSLSSRDTLRMIGYCPQVDPLLELLTGEELLWFFGRIRGIPVSELNVRVSSLITQLGLQAFRHRQCGRYSGGNKRKLSLGIALIGDPKVLLLDEPSTGMDPESRRKMWNVIQHVSLQRSVVLVSHSMEECEALCTRISIMVSGRIQCIGTSQHLKHKFGAGYQIEIRCKDVFGLNEPSATSPTPASTVSSPTTIEESMPILLQKCYEMCRELFTSFELLETHGSYFRIRTPHNIDLVQTFETIEKFKGEYGIVDYSVTQASLEQIFLKFAKEQEEERGTTVPYLIGAGALVDSHTGGIPGSRGELTTAVDGVI